MSTWESIKWQLFKGLNLLSDLASSVNKTSPVITVPNGHEETSKKPCIWVFCSTIGEFNACKPLLDKLVADGRLVLLTDHDCYTQTYRKRYPAATVVELTGRIFDGQTLVRRFPPDVFLICEIPAMPNEAPCRLSYGILRAANRAGARIYLVNAWLYGYDAACRMDALERRWFTCHYLQLFDRIAAQTSSVKEELVARGVDSQRITISGNMKFDALKEELALPPVLPDAAFQQWVSERDGKVLVAGCLASLRESETLINLLPALKRDRSAMYTVLAPRHPENKQFMNAFLRQIGGAGLTFQLKSQANGDFPNDSDVLVLDTFGELKQYYAIADVCYVGCNHNILEPLSFARPTVISGEWETTYPSFPVYCLAKERGVVYEEQDPRDLQKRLQALLKTNAADKQAAHIRQSLNDLSGAVDVVYATLDVSVNGKQRQS